MKFTKAKTRIDLKRQKLVIEIKNVIFSSALPCYLHKGPRELGFLCKEAAYAYLILEFEVTPHPRTG